MEEIPTTEEHWLGSLTGRLLTMWLNLKPGGDLRGYFVLKAHCGPIF